MYNIKELAEICEHLSCQETKANQAQRESIRYKQCEYLAKKIGEEFKGIISSVTEFGVFVEIVENGCDGLVGKEALESANLHIDQENYCINNFNNGETYRLGDEVTIKVAKVNMTRKQVDFKIIL